MHRESDINTHTIFDVESVRGGIRGTVVARWTAVQQVERSILRQGHDSQTPLVHSL